MEQEAQKPWTKRQTGCVSTAAPGSLGGRRRGAAVRGRKEEKGGCQDWEEHRVATTGRGKLWPGGRECVGKGGGEGVD